MILQWKMKMIRLKTGIFYSLRMLRMAKMLRIFRMKAIMRRYRETLEPLLNGLRTLFNSKLLIYYILHHFYWWSSVGNRWCCVGKMMLSWLKNADLCVKPGILTLTIAIFMSAHVVGCMWFFFGTLTEDDKEGNILTSGWLYHEETFQTHQCGGVCGIPGAILDGFSSPFFIDIHYDFLLVFYWFSIGFLLIFIICTTAGTEDYNATCVCIIKSSFFSRNSRYFNRNSGFFNRKSGALRSAMTSKLSPTSRPMWVKMMNFVFKTRNVVFETRNCALNMMYFAGCIAVLGDHYSLHRRLRWYYCVDRCVYYLEIKPFWW